MRPLGFLLPRVVAGALVCAVAAALAPTGTNQPTAVPGRGDAAVVDLGVEPHRAVLAATAPEASDTAGPASVGPGRRPRPRPRPRRVSVYLTGYSFHDNTPPDSAMISHPLLHRRAGGQGTYRDPITVAVPGGPTAMTWLPGTRFYLPTVRRYVIVEDSGASPVPRGVAAHLDLWIDGRRGADAATEDCMSRLTGTVEAVVSPLPGLPVLTGPIFTDRCRLPLPLLGRL